jgi:hypothetical protein
MRQIVQAVFPWGAAIIVLMLAQLAMIAGPAQAAASSGCIAANRGDMNSDVRPGQGSTREVKLDAGDVLSIAVTTTQSASVVLMSGAGAPKTLYSGPSTASLVFPAKDASSYAFQFTADTSSATVRVRCASAEDAAARGAFLSRRNDLLTGQEPDRTRIDRPNTPVPAPAQTPTDIDSLGKPKTASVSISVSELAAAANPGAKSEPSILDFWLEGRVQPYETADIAGVPAEGNLGVMYVGSKYMVGPDIMIGALAQVDRADETASRASTEVSAGGWMAGPYASVRFGPGVIFDGRMAWGETESGVSGLTVDSETMDRRMMRGTLRGTRQIGAWTLAPSVGVSYLEDTPQTHTSATSEEPQSLTPSAQGRIDVMPELKRRFDVDSETFIEPRAAVGGFLSFDDFSKLNPAAVTAAPDLHMKAEAGVAVGVKDGMNLEAKGGVESGGEAQPDNWMGRFQLNVPLNK